MNRRNFINSAASAGLAGVPAAAAPGRNAIYELRYIRLRNGNQVQRTNDFLGKYFVPAAQRAKIGPIGIFNAVIAEGSPFVLMLISYPSLNEIEPAIMRLESDEELQKGVAQYNSLTEPGYMRMENSLLRAFDGLPQVVVPPTDGKRAPRIFELRTYESSNGLASMRKIKMFNDGEIAIFQRLGMMPIFFGQTLVGRNLPNLTYMLAFDDLAAREKLWRAFGSDPEWQKLRAIPELADALIVSNISNAILRPAAFSQIR
jgi:hypothetical protein